LDPTKGFTATPQSSLNRSYNLPMEDVALRFLADLKAALR
jgi:hypothetical protein